MIEVNWKNKNSKKDPYLNTFCNTDLIFFSLLSRDNKGQNLDQITDFTYCKEIFLHYFLQALNIKELLNKDLFIAIKYRYWNKKIKKFEAYRHNKACTKTAINVLNSIEKEKRWSFSKIVGTKKLYITKGIEEQCLNIFIIRPCFSWFLSPQSLCLYLLILRLGRLNGINEVNSIKELENAKLDLNTSYLPFIENPPAQMKNDLLQFLYIQPYISKIMYNYEELFLLENIRKNYLSESTKTGGIINFIKKECANVALKQRWTKILKNK